MSAWYQVTITALQPVSAGRSGARGFLTPTYPYLPGSVVRGALARAWMTRYGEPDQRFIEVFERQVRYGPALPPGVEQEAQTVVRCKYHRASSDHEEVYDRAYGSGQRVCDPAYGTRPPQPCHSWEPSNGQLTWRGTGTVTSTALQAGTITVAPEQLFSRGTLPRSTVFTGHLVAEQEVPELAEIERVVVGGRGSVMGESCVEITLTRPPAVDCLLVTQTPAILVDPYGRPTLDPGFCLEMAGVRSGSRWQWEDPPLLPRAQVEGMGGWHIASGMPKPGEIAVAPGLVIGLEDPEDARRLLEHGLGLRRLEGFGWLVPYTPQPPGSPPRAAGQERPTSVADSWTNQLDELAANLTPEQASWLADQIREVPPGDIDQTRKVLTQPAADHVSTQQRRQVEKLLTEAPRDLRSALAHHLDSRYGKGAQA